ncbi:hypothetical protein PIB30_115180, partial [Stylosanthes scabra]|nr:hypothetical protein [Stylosanthes scabra]
GEGFDFFEDAGDYAVCDPEIAGCPSVGACCPGASQRGASRVGTSCTERGNVVPRAKAT